MQMLRGILVACILTLSAPAIGCGGGETAADAGGHDVTDAAAHDAGGDDAGSATDAGSMIDAGSTIDAGGDADGGAMADAGASPDASAPSDAGPRPDARPPTCSDDLGAFCDDTTPCATGFECQIGRCAPQDRDVCGGFAGWTCPRTAGSPYTECLYYDSADFGPCFTPEERDCLCARPSPGFACP
jgi:hypothetical protein